jgi:hypothetical protein
MHTAVALGHAPHTGTSTRGVRSVSLSPADGDPPVGRLCWELHPRLAAFLL